MLAYIRFVVADNHRNSGKEFGVFHAVLRLREEGKLYGHEEELHDSTRHWFNEHLEKPTLELLVGRGSLSEKRIPLPRRQPRKDILI
jgi:hypothetical protein